MDHQTTAQRVQYVIHGFQSRLQPDGVAKAEAVLAAALTPASRLEQEAQRHTLVAKLQETIGNRDCKQAQQFGERLALTQQSVPSDLQLADPTRQAAFERLQGLQQHIRQLDSDQDAAEQALRDATREGDEKKIAEKHRDFQAAKARRQKGWNELQEAVAQLKREHPQLAALLRAEPVDLSRWQSRLQDHQRLVRYLLLEDEGWAFVLSGHTIETVKLPAGWKALREPIRDYRLLLQTSAQNRGFTLNRGFIPDPPAGSIRNAVALSQHLSQQVLEPPRPCLNDVTHLLIVPNGPLHDLPFAALPWDGQFLAERFHLSTLSSTSLLATLDLQPSAVPPQLVALGNPRAEGWSPLPASEQEVQTLATLLAPPVHPQPAIYLREEAQRNRLIGQDLNGKVLHLAIHGQAGTLDDTRLILSDGPLKVGEVWGMALKQSPLVVLSACQTALGEHLGGDEVVSLANGFMVTGAQSVVSSLWPVPDQPTQVLMEEFYRQRAQGHAAALAAAQRTLIQQGRDPYHWAGFIVAGW